MPGEHRTLTEDDLWVLTGQVDVPAVLRSVLAAVATAVREEPEPADDEPPVLTVPDPATGGRATLPAPAVRAIRTAGCAAVAARDRLRPGVVTAGVIGPAPAVWWHVRVLCRAIPAITHLAVTDTSATPPPFLADQLDFAGIGLTCVPTASAAAFGANLVIAAGDAALTAEEITTGAVLVEATPDAYPPALRDGAAQDTFHVVCQPPDHHARDLDTALAEALLTAAGP